MSETQTRSQSRSQGRSQSRSRVKTQVESQGGVESGSQVKSSTKSQGGARSRQSSARQPANQLDVDGVLVGRKVVIAVVVGNEVARVVGTIIAMGRYWVVVNVEDSEIPTIQGTVYLNKGSVIAYMPVDSETPGSNHDSKTKH